MTFKIENPFSDYGTIVSGERFIGRKESLNVIESRCIRPKEPGNLAIIGEPRIGKSSLVYKAVIECKEKLINKKIVPLMLNLSKYDKPIYFFRSLVSECMTELEELGWVSEPIQRSAERALQDEFSWIEGYGKIQRFFEKVRHAGYRILFVLDEFDHARFLFKDNISGFQGLRELSYRPEWRVTFITTSRRSIRNIEIQSGAISTLDGIFHKHYLAMFDYEALQEYYKRLLSVGISFSQEDKKSIDFYCGGHPYLLELLGYEIVEFFIENQRIDIEKSANRSFQAFLNQYDHTIHLLKEDKSLKKLVQILIGPAYDIKPTEVDEFLKYGLIKLTSQQTYCAYSKHFQIYLDMQEREIGFEDLWPVWRDTEKALRLLITTTLFLHYGENWIKKLEKRSNLKSLFENCRNAQQKEELSFGSRASKNLIDFTYPKDLFAIIFVEWNIFKSIFGKDKGRAKKNYWEQHIQLLSKIRNPL